jgi:hypothetical protein
VVGVAAIVGILYVAGCFASRISASRAAAILKNDEPSWRHVLCRPYAGGYWDYNCSVDSRHAGRFSFLVKVNGSGIIDQSAP